MTDPLNNNPDPAGGTLDPTSVGITGNNPAWNDLLGSIPSQFHEKMVPHLQSWDKGVQEKINGLQTEYKQYEPWKDLVKAGWEPQQVNVALSLAQSLEEDPVKTIQTLHNYFSQQNPQFLQQLGIQQNPQQPQLGQPQLGQQNPDLGEVHPQILAEMQRQQQTIDTMAQILLTQKQQAEQEQHDADLDNEFSTLHQKFKKDKGYDFDEQTVMGLLMGANNINTPEEAVQEWYNRQEAFLQQRMGTNRGPSPVFLGSGGSLPSNRPNYGKMGEVEFNKVVVDFLAAAKQSNG